MTLKTYNSEEVSINWAGIPINGGFADGEFCTIEYDTEKFSDVAGTDGEVTRSKTNDNRATVTVTLMQTADANTALLAALQADLATPGGAGVGPLFVRDGSGREIFAAEKAWIQNFPGSTFDRSATSRAWVFRCAKLLQVAA